MPAPVLVFGYGNPSRGDDGLGPALLDRIDALRAAHPEWADVELLTDFQLQVEHVLDMKGRDLVLFVDADLAARPPYTYQRIRPARGSSYTTHALAPQNLLHVYEQVIGASPPPSYLLGIRGERFDLGEPISEAAARNLASAVAFTAGLLGRRDPEEWEVRADA